MWNKEKRRVFAAFETADQLALALSSADLTRLGEVVHAMENLSNLRESYWNCFHTEEYFLTRRPDILFIGFQETYNADFQRLREIWGWMIQSGCLKILHLPTSCHHL